MHWQQSLKKKMQSAIDEILLLSENQPKKARPQDVGSDSEANTSRKLSPSKKRLAGAKEVPLSKRQREMEKSSEEHINEVDSNMEESICSEEQVVDSDYESEQRSETSSGTSSSSRAQSPCHRKPSAEVENNAVPEKPIVLHDSFSNFLQEYKKEGGFSNKLKNHHKRNPHPANPNPPVYVKIPTPASLDILTVCDYVREKKVVATKKRIGFIGLGVIGQGIVKSLLNTGHDVTVWDHTAEVCQPFLAAGAQCAETPADVVLASDIIFSCLEDQEDVKNFVFYSKGVINGFDRSSEPGKIYAEMTLINKQLSEDIRIYIVKRDGKYLEAGFYGTKEMAENGKLVLYVAGNPAAYKDCESCFKAMSRTMKYTGTNLGNVPNFAIHMLEGKISAGVAEAFHIAEKCNISREDFFKLLKLSPYYCELMKDTGEAILSRDYSPKVSISRILNAMKLAHGTSSGDDYSSYLGNAVQRLYAKAQQFNYGSHDMSAVYLLYGLPRQSVTSAQEVQPESDSAASDGHKKQ
ncbi:cytokine-like nuclear factor N-PAC isoform X2 [Uloborus diversus]|uniref:cytokine-like nuclear factor N-PAC isoform X2 n=1 Tax=Uloborus diversus TaxID=327109 RepID=UPI00240A0DE2|nr:cytokine-like nuclear factor N-PAC isoform X2 [Uloborus diversus]